MRKLIYFIATSMDGFVSRDDGDISDFSFEGSHVEDLLRQYPETIPTHLRQHFELSDRNQVFDTVLMGAATYKVGLDLGFSSPYQHMRQYVFSRKPQPIEGANVQIVHDSAVETVRELKSEDSDKNIWLCGGPVLATNLIDEIDEVILKTNPFLIGKGKTLFTDPFAKKALELKSRKAYDNGFLISHFEFAGKNILQERQ